MPIRSFHFVSFQMYSSKGKSKGIDLALTTPTFFLDGIPFALDPGEGKQDLETQTTSLGDPSKFACMRAILPIIYFGGSVVECPANLPVFLRSNSVCFYLHHFATKNYSIVVLACNEPVACRQNF